MSSCDAVLLKKEYEKLKAKLDDSFVGDWFIKKSVNESISRLKDIIKIQKAQLKNDKVMPYCHLSGACAEIWVFSAALCRGSAAQRQNKLPMKPNQEP